MFLQSAQPYLDFNFLHHQWHNKVYFSEDGLKSKNLIVVGGAQLALGLVVTEKGICIVPEKYEKQIASPSQIETLFR
ncbi:hypothetical protein B9T25_07565 [Acinetobacter sp. ANC 4470]|uniref:hypothetical protein n=1 Tax=Acinetobacter sp. ANC 4470 TaxID=1977881 RepID=UPI000A347608|nr:hypothetical protein [Acinetobacter sp. ANC 4470]OTG67831.1 hypothetical protein B9T25_07565 [Acinetobacter sp. ANC 4470]